MSKPEPVLPENVERALLAVDSQYTCKHMTDEEGKCGDCSEDDLARARRAIAATIRRAEAEAFRLVCDGLIAAGTGRHPNLLATIDRLIDQRTSEADALEKED